MQKLGALVQNTHKAECVQLYLKLFDASCEDGTSVANSPQQALLLAAALRHVDVIESIVSAGDVDLD